MSQKKPTLIDHLLTIPEAQVKIFDLEWQSAFYSVFHQTRTSQLLHAFCMAPIVLSLFMLGSYVNFGDGHLVKAWPAATQVNGAFLILMVLTVWYLRMDIKVGLATLPVIITIWFTANLFNFYLGLDGIWIALLLLFITVFLQTLSHKPEPVPPPHSGTAGFMSFEEWSRTSSLRHKIKVSSLFPIFMIVELISSPRLLPVQILHLMHHFGYKKDLFRKTEERAKRVLQTGDYNAYYSVT